MTYELDASGKGRLDRFFDGIGGILRRRDRRESFAMYAMGLFGEGERKSVEPIAARACADPELCNAYHHRLLHFVAVAPWSDRDVRAYAAGYGIGEMTAREPVTDWIIDDTGFPKQGDKSPGVQRQYSGTLGRTGNCQIAVSVTVATPTMHLPIDMDLYLPQSWTGLGGDALELLVDRLDPIDAVAQDIPLGRRRDGRTEIVLQLLGSMEGNARAVVHHGDHAAGGLVALFSLGLGRRTSGEHVAAGAAAKLLAVKAGGPQRSPPDDPNEGRGGGQLVDTALCAERARVSPPQRLVIHGDVLRRAIGGGGHASVTLALFFRGWRRWLRRTLRGRGGGAGIARGRVLRLDRRMGRLRRRVGHVGLDVSGLLIARESEETPHPRQRGVGLAQLAGHLDHGRRKRFDEVVVVVTDDRPDALQHRRQVVQVDVTDGRAIHVSTHRAGVFGSRRPADIRTAV